MRRYAIRILTTLAMMATLVWAYAAQAYPTYTGTPCATCHSGFEGRGALHDTHLAFISNNCGMCHPTSPGSKPVSTYQANDATSKSCLGCHGRDYGGTIGTQAAGLRAHHAAHGVTVCAGCHTNDPVPLSEHVKPPHYLRADVSRAVCFDNLDNDGDDLYDTADPDCSGVPVDQTTWGRIKSLYR